MIAAEVDAIPDGPFGQFIPAKEVLRAVLAIAPDLEQQTSALIGALLLLVKDEPRAHVLLRTLAEGLDHAARITAARTHTANVVRRPS